MTKLKLDKESRLSGKLPTVLESWKIVGSGQYEALHIVNNKDVEVIYVPPEEGFFCAHVVHLWSWLWRWLRTVTYYYTPPTPPHS